MSPSHSHPCVLNQRNGWVVRWFHAYWSFIWNWDDSGQWGSPGIPNTWEPALLLCRTYATIAYVRDNAVCRMPYEICRTGVRILSICFQLWIVLISLTRYFFVSCLFLRDIFLSLFCFCFAFLFCFVCFVFCVCFLSVFFCFVLVLFCFVLFVCLFFFIDWLFVCYIFQKVSGDKTLANIITHRINFIQDCCILLQFLRKTNNIVHNNQ